MTVEKSRAERTPLALIEQSFACENVSECARPGRTQPSASAAYPIVWEHGWRWVRPGMGCYDTSFSGFRRECVFDWG